MYTMELNDNKIAEIEKEELANLSQIYNSFISIVNNILGFMPMLLDESDLLNSYYEVLKLRLLAFIRQWNAWLASDTQNFQQGRETLLDIITSLAEQKGNFVKTLEKLLDENQLEMLKVNLKAFESSKNSVVGIIKQNNKPNSDLKKYYEVLKLVFKQYLDFIMSSITQNILHQNFFEYAEYIFDAAGIHLARKIFLEPPMTESKDRKLFQICQAAFFKREENGNLLVPKFSNFPYDKLTTVSIDALIPKDEEITEIKASMQIAINHYYKELKM